MASTMNKMVNIDNIYFDEELYPRMQENWQTEHIYAEAMKSGSAFPPISLALLNKKFYLIDGKHRLEAYKTLKYDKVKAKIYTGMSRKQIFKEAVKINVSHGRSLSPYEKRKATIKLMRLNCSKKEISGIINIPKEKLTDFVGHNLINNVTGEVIKPGKYRDLNREIMKAKGGESVSVIKSPLKNYSKSSHSPQDISDVEEIQSKWDTDSQKRVLQQTIDLIREDLLDEDDQKVMELYDELVSLIKQ